MKKILSLLITLTLVLSTVCSVCGMTVAVSAANDATSSTAAYITDFKGTTGDAKVTLSWEALSGVKEYSIYWKRSSAEKWTKIATVKKTSVSVSKLKNGVSYDFKIVAGSVETPVLTITPSASKSETVYAKKPESGDTAMRSITSSQMAAEMGVGLNLGNTFEAYWAQENKKYTGSQIIGDGSISNYEKCWGAVITTEEAIKGMKNAGFNTVRIPVYWGNGMKDDGKFNINKDLLKRVREVVDYCLDNGLYAVINIHHYDGFIVDNFSPDEAVDIFGKLWKQIAEEFKDYPDHLVFEGYNESLGSTREKDKLSTAKIYDYVNSANQVFVDSVRKTGGNNDSRMLIVSGYWTNIDLTTDSKFKIPKDTVKDRIMVSVHYIDNAMYWSNNIGSQQWKNYIDDQCERLKKAFTDKGYSVFVGETTGGYDDRLSSSTKMTSTECIEYLMSKALDYGFVPVIWDVNDGFYSRTDCKIKDSKNAEMIKRMAKKAAKRATEAE